MNLHERIAAALGWPLRDVQSMSLASLRELVRPVSGKLADELTQRIRSGEVILANGESCGPSVHGLYAWLAKQPSVKP